MTFIVNILSPHLIDKSTYLFLLSSFRIIIQIFTNRMGDIAVNGNIIG